MTIKNRIIVIVNILSLWLLLPACSGKETAFIQNSPGYDRLTESKLLSMTIVYEQFKDLSLLGVIDKVLIFRNNTDNSLLYYNGLSDKQDIEVDLDKETIRSYPLQSGLLMTDSLGKGPYLLSVTKTSLKTERLPYFPIELSNAQISIIEKNGILFLAASAQDTLMVFSWDRNAMPEKQWEILTHTRLGSDKSFLMSVQSNGTDNCLYVFIKGSGILCYNLRLDHWTKKEIDTQPIEQTYIAFGQGAAHVVFPHSDGHAISLFNTVTDTFFEMQIQPTEGALKGVQVSDNQVLAVYYDESDQSLELRTLSVEKVKNGFSAIDIIVLVLYFGVLVFIGYYFSKRQKNSDDYFRGGQRIPWWAAGLSLFGTALSAITFMAIPAKSYATNWSYMLFNGGILMVAPIIMFVFIPFFRKLNITTAYEYLEVRFNSLIRVVCSLAFIVFQVGRMGIILLLPAIAINVVTGFDIFLCIILMGVFSIIYTRMGGIEAVVWTDALQVVILLGGALYAIFHIVAQIPGGWEETFSVAYSNGKMSFGSTAFDLSDSTMWTVLIATFFTNLTTYGTDQSMVQRYLTTSSQKAARKSIMTNALLIIPSTLIFFFIGTALYVYYKNNPADATSLLESNDAIFPWYIYTRLPAGIVGLLIAGIFSAAMSTLSGSMNSVATAYVVDIRPKLMRKKPAADLKVARRATLIAGALSLCFAIFMATWNISSLWDEFNKILGLILGSMGGLFLLGMITRKANAPGALIGMAVSIVVQIIVANYTPVHLLLYTTVGFITCFVVGYLASYFFKTNKTIV